MNQLSIHTVIEIDHDKADFTDDEGLGAALYDIIMHTLSARAERELCEIWGIKVIEHHNSRECPYT